MARRRGWSQFSTDEKLEALKADVNTALDMAEHHKRQLEEIQENVKRIAAYISEIARASSRRKP